MSLTPCLDFFPDPLSTIKSKRCAIEKNHTEQGFNYLILFNILFPVQLTRVQIAFSGKKKLQENPTVLRMPGPP
jgi:hypothetical protein